MLYRRVRDAISEGPRCYEGCNNKTDRRIQISESNLLIKSEGLRY